MADITNQQVLDALITNGRQLKHELKVELKQELKQELRQELGQDFKQELDTRFARNSEELDTKFARAAGEIDDRFIRSGQELDARFARNTRELKDCFRSELAATEERIVGAVGQMLEVIADNMVTKKDLKASEARFTR